MGVRRDGREAAAQFLYSRDISPGEDSSAEAESLAQFWTIRTAKENVRSFGNALISGVLQHIDEIDPILEGASENFSLDRFATIDRNILRVAVYEILHTSDVPVPVVINEAIEVARRLSNTESAKFVNGILHRVSKECART